MENDQNKTVEEQKVESSEDKTFLEKELTSEIATKKDNNSYPTPSSKKKQSYLIALIATSIIAFSSVNISFTRDANKQTQITISTREVSVTTLVPCLLLMASALGFDTDKLALLIGKIFNINQGNRE